MNPFKKLLGQTAIYGLSTILGRFLNYALVPIYTYTLKEQSDYGLVTELYTYVGILMVVITYGTETGFFRFAAKVPSPHKLFVTVQSLLYLTSALFLAIGLLFLHPISAFIGHSGHYYYVLMMMLIPAVDTLTALPFALLRHQGNAKRFSAIKLANIGINLSLNLFFVLLCPYLKKHGWDGFTKHLFYEEYMVGYIFISNLVASLVTFIMLQPSWLKQKFNLNRPLLKKILFYSIPLMFAQLASTLNLMADKILLHHFISVPAHTPDPNTYALEQVGIYGANTKVAILMSLFIMAYRYAAEPFFFLAGADENAKAQQSTIMRFFIIFGLLIFLGVMFYIDVIKYMIGPSYRQGLSVVPVLLLAYLFNGILFNLSFWYKLTDQTRFAIIISVVGVAITLLFNYLLIPRWGYQGSAWTMLICYLSMTLLSYLLGRKYNPIDYKLGRIFSYISFALLLFFISKITGITQLWLQLAVNTLLLAVFIGLVMKAEGISRFRKKAIKPSRNQSGD